MSDAPSLVRSIVLMLAVLLASAGARDGPANEHGGAPAAPSEPVKIGLVLPAVGVPEGEAVRRGAERAVAEANRNGGYQGRPFELVVRTEDGLWGTGTRHIADLISREKVWAVVGSVDGRSAHLIEQVVTKARVPFVSPWASDPTLTQINLPWFFRCIPDDRQQAAALLEEIFARRKLKRVATVVAPGYDGRVAEAAFHDLATKAGRPVAARFALDDGGLAARIRRGRYDGLVLFGRPAPMAAFLGDLQGAAPVVFGSLVLHDAAFLAAAVAHGVEVAVVASPRSGTAWDDFEAAYRRAYGHVPSLPAAYAFDGVSTLAAAMRVSGLDRRAIQKALSAIVYPRGVTGPVRFDARGNRLGPVAVAVYPAAR